MIVVEVPLGLVDFDGERARRDTSNYIYRDLLFFHSLGGSRPGAVAGELVDGRVSVHSRARNAAVAEDLGLTSIECVLPAQTQPGLLERFSERPDVRLVSEAEIEFGIPKPGMEWHVIGFKRIPGDEEISRFTGLMRQVFADPEQPIVEAARAESDPTLLYFQAWTPHEREAAISLLTALQRCDLEIAPLRSYRGMSFRHQMR